MTQARDIVLPRRSAFDPKQPHLLYVKIDWAKTGNGAYALQPCDAEGQSLQAESFERLPWDAKYDYGINSAVLTKWLETVLKDFGLAKGLTVRKKNRNDQLPSHAVIEEVVVPDVEAEPDHPQMQPRVRLAVCQGAASDKPPLRRVVNLLEAGRAYEAIPPRPSWFFNNSSRTAVVFKA